MADMPGGHELVASFFTLTGAGFGEEPRHSFAERVMALETGKARSPRLELVELS